MSIYQGTLQVSTLMQIRFLARINLDAEVTLFVLVLSLIELLTVALDDLKILQDKSMTQLLGQFDYHIHSILRDISGRVNAKNCYFGRLQSIKDIINHFSCEFHLVRDIHRYQRVLRTYPFCNIFCCRIVLHHEWQEVQPCILIEQVILRFAISILAILIDRAILSSVHLVVLVVISSQVSLHM